MLRDDRWRRSAVTPWIRKIASLSSRLFRQHGRASLQESREGPPSWNFRKAIGFRIESERDALCLVAALLKAKRQLKENCAILIYYRDSGRVFLLSVPALPRVTRLRPSDCYANFFAALSRRLSSLIN
jgi:hypothetical protein